MEKETLIKIIRRVLQQRWKLILVTALFLSLFSLFWFSLPGDLFEARYSTVIPDRNGRLLSAAIAADGQWRFPPDPELPEKFKHVIILYEEKRFFRHMGVDPLAVARAVRQNREAGGIVSGASTITMQVIRLSRDNSGRTYRAKILEMIAALWLELTYSKEEILAMFAARAETGIFLPKSATGFLINFGMKG